MKIRINLSCWRFACVTILFALLLLPHGQVGAQSTGSVTDARDGKVYQTVKLGDKVWLAQNLNYVTADSWCYLDKPEFCAENGRLYTWDAAMKACPAGWSLPTDKDWAAVEKLYGGAEIAGRELLHGGKSGFNASLGGIRCGDGSFVNSGIYGDYWTATADAEGNVYMRYFFVQHRKIYRLSFHKDTGRSVRCIKD